MRSSVCHLLKLPRSFNCLMDLKVSHLTQNIYSVRQQYAAFGWNVLFVRMVSQVQAASARCSLSGLSMVTPNGIRSEEHTSELQSLAYLVCRLLLEKKNKLMIKG